MAAKRPSRSKRRKKPIEGTPATAEPGQSSNDVFPVVGIGASAGGLEAFSELLSALPRDIPMAIVLVQHLDPKHPSMLSTLLTRTTPMPVVEVSPGTRVEPAHVYVIPPNTTMTIEGRVLRLSPRVATAALHMPIDQFLRSLSEDLGERAIGVVLSGNASDGALGLKAIKGEGGVTFVQDPQTARFDGMPRNAIASGGIDFVLAPAGIATELARIGGHPYVSGPAAGALEDEPSGQRALTQIFRMLQQESGVDFRLYRQTTIRRRIARRMLVHRIDTLEGYRRYLNENRAELQTLYNEVLIGVTRFFRDADAFDAVQRAMVARPKRQEGSDRPLRVWVPGCATGEEAYSLAMVLLEALERTGAKVALQIFATDVNDVAVAQARGGVYPANIELDVSPERLRRFFTKLDGQYQVKKSLRELCIFARHNLAKDPPFSTIDVVSCRNVLIYFDAATQRRIMHVFHYALRDGGLLLLGASESVGPLGEQFSLIDRKHKLYVRQAGPERARSREAAFEFVRSEGEGSRGTAGQAGPLQPDGQREVDRVLLSRYAPAGVLVNDGYEILQFRGHTGPYLEAAQGQASLSLIKMARDGLLIELRAAIAAARKRNAPVRREGLRVKQETGVYLPVNVEVIPVRGPGDERTYLVVFENATRTRERRTPAARRPAALKGEPRVIERLTDELTATKEFLQSIIEDREAANEELRSANEELQSSNEELQSTNEELETAKEELQSVNEELETVNEELQHRNAELALASNDTNNLIASVNLPIVFVGRDLRIRRFTPMASGAFNLIGADLGRPIGSIRGSAGIPDLEPLCAQVIAQGASLSVDVRDHEDRWHSLHIRPYRTGDNAIDGAVVMLIDITTVKNSLERADEARDYAEAVVDTVRTPLVVLDEGYRVRSANRAFYETFGATPEQTVNRVLYDLGDGQWNIPALRRAVSYLMENGTAFDDFEVEHDFPSIGPRIMLLNGRRVRQDAPHTVLLAIEDITPRRQAERELRASEEVRYRRLFETARDGIALLDADSGQVTTVNPHWTALTGLSAEQSLGRTLPDLGVFQNPEMVRTIVRELQQRDFNRYADLELTRADGTPRHVELICNAYHIGGRRVIQCMARDITERVELLQRERAARAEAEAANRAKDDFLSVLSHELRTPLTAMLGWVRVLRRGALEPSRTAGALETVERNTRLLAQLIEDLLDVSRIAAGKLAIEVRRVDVATVVRAAVETIRESAEVKAIDLTVNLPAEPAVVRGDRHRLQQAVWNLLSNAVKFTPNGGRIDCTLESVPPGVRVTVADTGRGISPQLLPLIFDRFRQGEHIARRTQGGLGLGLAIVRHLVELHGGRVTGESGGEGAGATFTIELPQAPPATGTTDEERDSPSSDAASDDTRLDGLRVLIIEDERDTAIMLAQVLGERGADATYVENAASALGMLERIDPHVVLSDIALPGEDGYALLRRIRALPRGGRVPAIALTAFARAEDVQRAMEAGFNVHLAKPIDPAELARAVAQVARARGERDGEGMPALGGDGR